MWVPNTPTVVLTGFTALAGGLCIFKDFNSGPAYNTKVLANGKVAIVTGANSGLGREAAWELAYRGAKVFMVCRDMKKCEKERREIVLETENRYVYCRPCDLSSFESIKQFVNLFKSEEPVLDILINNAGVMRCPKSLTKDGIEMHLGVNHMGHFLLTNLLLDSLQKSEHGRVVTVTSDSHYKGKIYKDDLNMNTNYDPGEAYNQSKLANVLFANELSRKLLETRITSNSVHPGTSDTNITRHMSNTKGVTGFITYLCFWPFIKKARVGAQTLIHAALEPTLSNVTGEYFVDMKKSTASPDALDLELALWLWKVSEKWTRLEENKKHLKKAQ